MDDRDATQIIEVMTTGGAVVVFDGNWWKICDDGRLQLRRYKGVDSSNERNMVSNMTFAPKQWVYYYAQEIPPPAPIKAVSSVLDRDTSALQ